MGARQKLNVAYFHGCLIVSALVGAVRDRPPLRDALPSGAGPGQRPLPAHPELGRCLISPE